MQAIQTKFLSPTNTRGARIKAWCDAGNITIPYPHDLGPGEAAFRRAAEALASKLDWTKHYYGKLSGGGLPNGNYVFTFVPAHPQCVKTFFGNVRHAVRNRETIIVGGGEFSPAELSEILFALEQ